MTVSHSEIKPLSALGRRICIIGPSNSGKSTLAAAIGRKLGIDCIHIDQLAHVPGTNWQRKPDAELVAAHDALIARNAWVIDGNYSVCMPQRFDRATGVIWLEMSFAHFLRRYLQRALKADMSRPGALTGATREFNWQLIRYTWRMYPRNRLKYRALLQEHAALPLVIVRGARGLRRLYSAWDLQR